MCFRVYRQLTHLSLLTLYHSKSFQMITVLWINAHIDMLLIYWNSIKGFVELENINSLSLYCLCSSVLSIILRNINYKTQGWFFYICYLRRGNTYSNCCNYCLPNLQKSSNVFMWMWKFLIPSLGTIWCTASYLVKKTANILDSFTTIVNCLLGTKCIKPNLYL